MPTNDKNTKMPRLREIIAVLRYLHADNAETVKLLDEARTLTYRETHKRTPAPPAKPKLSFEKKGEIMRAHVVMGDRLNKQSLATHVGCSVEQIDDVIADLKRATKNGSADRAI